MIQEFSAPRLQLHLGEFVRLLGDAVENGASIGFVLPLPEEESRAYWTGVTRAVAAGHRRLLVALDAERVVGAIQLDLEARANGNHRAEVTKLMVLTSHRRQGLARALLDATEALAKRLNRTTLFLDTRLGDPAERLYQGAGYTFVGSIPAYAKDIHGVPEPNAIYYKLLK